MEDKLATMRRILADPATFTTPLVVSALDAYGTECLAWAPETLVLELSDDYRVRLPPLVRDRLAAGVRLLTTDGFYKDLEEHVRLANVLAGTPASFQIFDPSDLEEEAWAISEAMLLAPPEPEDAEPFVDDIRRYIGKLAGDAGLLTLPDVLRIAVLPDSRQRVQMEFADDPVVYQGIVEMELAKAEQLEQMVRNNMQQLFDQLAALPVAGVSDSVLKLRARLDSTPRSGTSASRRRL